MVDEAQRPVGCEPVVTYERSALNSEVVHIIRDGRYASYWLRPGGHGDNFEWDWWAALEKWPEHSEAPVHKGRGGELCAQAKALELLGVK